MIITAAPTPVVAHTIRIRVVLAVVLAVALGWIAMALPGSSTTPVAPPNGPPSSSEILAAMHGGQ